MFVISANQETGLAEPLSDWWRGEKGFPSSWAGGQGPASAQYQWPGPSARPTSPFLTSLALLQLGPSIADSTVQKPKQIEDSAIMHTSWGEVI